MLIGFLFVREYKRVAKEPVNSWTESQSADCAIVLTGAAGRVREGFDLLARKDVQKLIIAGVHPNATLREIMPLWSLYGNLDEKDVALDRHSTTTFGNAVQSFPLVEALRCRDVILVTSQLHMYRARRTFRAVFPEDFAIQTRAIVSGGRYHSGPWDITIEVLK